MHSMCILFVLFPSILGASPPTDLCLKCADKFPLQSFLENPVTIGLAEFLDDWTQNCNHFLGRHEQVFAEPCIIVWNSATWRAPHLYQQVHIRASDIPAQMTRVGHPCDGPQHEAG